MFYLANSLFNTYQAYSTDQTPKCISLLVKEMEARQEKMPLGDEKEALKQQISDIKTTSKTQEISKNLLKTGIALAKFASGYVNPVMFGIVTHLTQNTENNLNDADQKVIQPARLKAGQRRQKNRNQKKQKHPSVISSTGKAVVNKLILDNLMNSSLANETIKYGKHLIFG